MLMTSTDVKKEFKISHTTLAEWEEKGLLFPLRTPGGHRRYNREDIVRLMSLYREDNIGYCLDIEFADLAEMPDLIKMVGYENSSTHTKGLYVGDVEESQIDWERVPLIDVATYRRVSCEPCCGGWRWNNQIHMSRFISPLIPTIHVLIKGKENPHRFKEDFLLEKVTFEDGVMILNMFEIIDLMQKKYDFDKKAYKLQMEDPKHWNLYSGKWVLNSDELPCYFCSRERMKNGEGVVPIVYEKLPRISN